MGRELNKRFEGCHKPHFGHTKFDTSKKHAEEDVNNWICKSNETQREKLPQRDKYVNY